MLEAADELGFVPKERAIARAKAGVGRIALVAPFSSYPSFAERMVAAMEALGPDGTQLVVFDHEDIATSDSPLLEPLPVRGHVDGIVIMGIPLEDSAAERLAARLPTVLIDQKHPLLSSVWVDDFGGGQMVGARLLADGHRRVVFVRETETSFLDDSPAQQRVNGLRSVLGADGVREITVSRTPSAGREVIDALRAFAAPARSFADDDFSVGVLELPYIFGTQPGRKPVWVFLVEQVRQMKGATLYPRGGTTMVTVRQVAQATARALERTVGGKAYPLGWWNMTWPQLLDIVHRYAGTPGKRVITIPTWMYVMGGKKIKKQQQAAGHEGGLDMVKFAAHASG